MLTHALGPIPLPQLASLPPTASPPLDNIAALPVSGTSTHHADPSSLLNGPLVPPTIITNVPGTGQSPPATELILSHIPSLDTSDSSTDFVITLLNPLPTPTQSGAAIHLLEHFYGQTLVVQKEIADHVNAFAAERKEAEAAVNAEVAKLEAQIRILKEQNYNDARILTATPTTSKPWPV